MPSCSSRCGDWHEVDEAAAKKCASSEAPLQTVALQERSQLSQLGQLVKLIYNQEPTLGSAPKDLEVDVEKGRPSLQSFGTSRLKKSSLEDESKFSSSLQQIQ